MDSDKLVKVGVITAPHGVRGALKLQALTDYPQRFMEISELPLYTKEGRFIRSLKVNRIRQVAGDGVFLVEAEGIEDRNSAEAMRGTVVMVHESERYSLAEGEYWVDDILGMKVVNHETGKDLGKVVNVIEAGGNDTYEILMNDSSRKFIPAVEEFIKRIDIDAKTMFVEVIEGLLD